MSEEPKKDLREDTEDPPEQVHVPDATVDDLAPDEAEQSAVQGGSRFTIEID